MAQYFLVVFLITGAVGIGTAPYTAKYPLLDMFRQIVWGAVLIGFLILFNWTMIIAVWDIELARYFIGFLFVTLLLNGLVIGLEPFDKATTKIVVTSFWVMFISWVAYMAFIVVFGGSGVMLLVLEKLNLI